MSKILTPADVVATARRWLGTPYIHQASAQHHGCDCLGLIRGVWRELIGDEPMSTPAYSADWGEVGAREILQTVADKYFHKQNCPVPEIGQLLLFRWSKQSIIKHLGIMTSPQSFIHAYEKAGVVESPFGHHWQKRIAGIYQFPGIES